MKSSRRKFLEIALSAPIAAKLRQPDLETLGAFPAPPGQMEFSNPGIIRYDSHCFTLKGQDTFLRSGAFHYCRCPRELWRDRLLKFKRAGFNTVETYVFWNYHEPVEGHLDLSEFEAFARAVKDMGLWLIVRPGPYISAEWDRGGFPAWVVAKRFQLRSNDPRSVETSKHWYGEVLPAIGRHQITRGGPIIMMQLENEYDYWPGVSDADKRAYISSLAETAWSAGIDIPLFTCWTKQARENSDPVMARIMDTVNFYPRWKIFPEVPTDLQQLRKDEATSPVAVTELQGGYQVDYGEELAAGQKGLDAATLELLTKTVIEQGATLYNYYMGFGGTSFDWARKHLITSYDYAAPIREPGGLWDKYYAARGICESLNFFGNVLTRAEAVGGGCASTNPSVVVSERVNDQSAVIFMRETANIEQHFKMTFVDPASPAQRPIQVPREGNLTLGPGEMKMTPVQVPISGGVLQYSTAEILAQGRNADRDFLIVYEGPDRVAEIALAASQEPQVDGETLYHYWDAKNKSAVFGVRVENKGKVLQYNNRLLIFVVPKEQALRSWVAEYPSSVARQAEDSGPLSVPFVTDAALLAEYGSEKNRIWAELDFRPGHHDLTVMLPPSPRKCRVDGAEREFKYDRDWRSASLEIKTPTIPYASREISEVRYWVERFDPSLGKWENGPLRPLDETGPAPFGYVKYVKKHAGIPQEDGGRLFVKSFAADWRKVFLSGRLIPELSSGDKEADTLLPIDLNWNGTDTIEISYEAFGSLDSEPDMSDLKGIESVKIGNDPASAREITEWLVQRVPEPMLGREVDFEFSAGGWKSGTINSATPRSELELIPAYTWCRAQFTMEKPQEQWFAPRQLTFEADRDALLYLNGRFVGRYVTEGPQKDFYLPEPYLNLGERNVLTMLLAYADEPGHIRTLLVGPYDEFATRRTRLEFEW